MVTYLNSAVHRGDRIPIEEYHLDTPLEEYDLVSRRVHQLRVRARVGYLRKTTPRIRPSSLYNATSAQS